MDVLSDVLRTVRLTGAVFFPMETSSPWADEIPTATAFAEIVLPGAEHVVSYHIVTEGVCWAALLGGSPIRLDAGDILVIPHGNAYVMSSAPGLPSQMSAEMVLEFFRQMAAGGLPGVVVEGGGGPDRAKVICGFLGCDIRPFNPVLEALPGLVHIRRPPAPSAEDRLGPVIEFALAESRQQRSGGRCVLLRLSEVLFVEVVRRYLEALPADHAGWLAGLRDPIVGRARSRGSTAGRRTPGRWSGWRGMSPSRVRRWRSVSPRSWDSRPCTTSRAGGCSSRQECSPTAPRRCPPSLWT